MQRELPEKNEKAKRGRLGALVEIQLPWVEDNLLERDMKRARRCQRRREVKKRCAFVKKDVAVPNKQSLKK